MNLFARSVLGIILGLIARVWLATLRVRVQVHPSLVESDERWVLAFFHGKQWPLLAWKRRKATGVMVSHSADGAIQTRALGLLGLTVVRGSSSRGGARGLMKLVRLLKSNHDVAFAVDGPRGPIGIPKPGVFLAARRGGALIVPMGSAMASGKVLHRAWDRFGIAWPFSRVAVVAGAPCHPNADGAELAEAIASANASAEAMLAANHADMVSFPRFLTRSEGRTKTL